MTGVNPICMAEELEYALRWNSMGRSLAVRPGNAMVETRARVEPTLAGLPSRLVIFTRFVWAFLSLAALTLFLGAIPALYSDRRVPPEAVQVGLIQLGLSASYYAVYYVAIQAAFALACLAVAVVIAWRRRDDGITLFTSLLLVLLGTTNHPNMRALVELYPALTVPATFGVFLAFTAIVLFLFVFPDGHFVPWWARIPVGACVAALLVGWYLPGSSLAKPSQIAGIAVICGFGTGVLAQGYRYRRVSGAVQRRQIRWVAFGTTVAAAVQIIFMVTDSIFPALTHPGVLALVWDLTFFTGVTLAFLLIPTSIGVAILRYRLWDIDAVINRTLVYGALTVVVAGLYVLVVGGLGSLLHGRGNLLISLGAAGLVAVLFAPLRARLQRGINRLMYGERDDPYQALSRLGQRLEATLVPDAVLPTIVQTVKDALRIPFAAIELRRADEPTLIASAGQPAGEATRLPLAYSGELVGELVLGIRAGEQTFGAADRRLLEDLARQAGAAVHALRLRDEALGLAVDLQRSREGLVTAREEERRRLRRDLHDGLGPQLASLTMKAEAARDLLPTDPASTDALLAEIIEQTQASIVDIRRLVYALRPPALDDLGLLAALRAHAAQHNHGSLRVTLVAPEHLPPLPAAVEVAAYRIVQEALANVARHAGAHNCTVRIWLDGDGLAVEVVDDGCGIPEERKAGVGLTSMRERAGELGETLTIEPLSAGGTRVRAHLPSAKPVAASAVRA
ncbi:MAG: sensor histidine kinase [Chloroflexota bacterium]|nr:sensor histidine kinase [Chloroflexota bacterium]